MKRALTLLLVLPTLCLAVGPVPCEAQAPPAPLPAPKADPIPPPLAIGGPLVVPRDRAVRLTAQGISAGSGLLWEVVPLDDKDAYLDWVSSSSQDTEQIILVAPPGRYAVELLVFSIDAGKPRIKKVKAVLTVQGAIPPPKVDPVEPAPAPKPKDTGPVTGLRVIFVRESSAKTPLTISSAAVRSYLDKKCAKAANGQPEWRVYDPQQELSATESPTMKAMWEAAKPKLGTLPQMIVTSDQRGEIHPLPATDAEALTILKTYGGE